MFVAKKSVRIKASQAHLKNSLLYLCSGRYEREGKARKTINAQQLWFAVLDAQVRLLPALLYPNITNTYGNQGVHIYKHTYVCITSPIFFKPVVLVV